jgi:RHS repeat-associated protein
MVSQLARSHNPYGRPNHIQGDLTPDFGYAGMYYYAPSGLNLTPYRAYDYDLGRWLSRDPLGEMFDINNYRFVYNSPIDYVDVKGLWPTAIHHQIIDNTFPNLSENDRAILKKASDKADGPIGQDPTFSYTHAMRSPWQSPEEARSLYLDFISGQISKAHAAQVNWCKEGKSGYSPDALYDIGLVLHAVADSTSPSHASFQEWNPMDPSSWLNDFYLHELQESVISYAEMEKTKSLLRQFFNVPFRHNVK